MSVETKQKKAVKHFEMLFIEVIDEKIRNCIMSKIAFLSLIILLL